MTLPSGDEYFTAVQNPRTAFADAELRECTAETTPLGLPRPFSGGFTTTYHLLDHGKQWAVRCFTRVVPELERRYEAIGRLIRRIPSRPLVDATCVRQGIRVGGVWHPVIKMQWVDGKPLNRFISENLTNSSSLAGLANQFAEVVHWLEGHGVAHGDLQHGNIIVSRGRMYLIDYDGFFVPELSSLRSNEIGHINYQHPQRTSDHFDAQIDRFSSFVIYLGLLAASNYPYLWGKYENSENILFRRDDFIDSDHSPLLAELRSLPRLAPLAIGFGDCCRLALDDLPTLEEFIQGKVPTSVGRAVARTYEPRTQYEVLEASDLQSLLDRVGARVEVVGSITEFHSALTKHGQPYMFLNFGSYPRQTFTLVFWSEALAQFSAAHIEPTGLVGKAVSVTGVVTKYMERPQMVVEVPSQIQPLLPIDRGRSVVPGKRAVDIPSTPTVRELASLAGLNPIDVLRRLLDKGVLVTLDQRIDADTAAKVLGELGVSVRSSQTTTGAVKGLVRSGHPGGQGHVSPRAAGGDDAAIFNRLYRNRPASRPPAPSGNLAGQVPPARRSAPSRSPFPTSAPQARKATPGKVMSGKHGRAAKAIAVAVILAVVGYLLWGFWGLLAGAALGYLVGQSL